MVEDSQDGVISLVNSIFDVEEFTKTEFTLQFKINNSVSIIFQLVNINKFC